MKLFKLLLAFMATLVGCSGVTRAEMSADSFNKINERLQVVPWGGAGIAIATRIAFDKKIANLVSSIGDKEVELDSIDPDTEEYDELNAEIDILKAQLKRMRLLRRIGLAIGWTAILSPIGHVAIGRFGGYGKQIRNALKGQFLGFI